MLNPSKPALVLAPMDGITDAPMRDLMGRLGAFSYAVTEFIRVTTEPVPAKVFRREVPELLTHGLTPSGLPVQVQILGGDASAMALSAQNAVKAGAKSIDINFGCPAPTVNRNDGGATLLKHPCRIEEIVRSVREAVSRDVSVSAKLRLGWERIDDIYENADRAAAGGASWLTIHARTRVQGYSPPVFWAPIRRVREATGLPVIANGDIWCLDDFKQCREEARVDHFMIGRSALARPELPHQIAMELGCAQEPTVCTSWLELLNHIASSLENPKYAIMRLKQWIKLAHMHGDFPWFHDLKECKSTDEFFARLDSALKGSMLEDVTA
ncbi:MAG TPA: tRNA-dihydrouridine synthase family protein [Fimbriimonadaceae bacterium]|nr:tRNA-dihydrouridine synthase family protein [Fimbriimonadaceae bacterium]